MLNKNVHIPVEDSIQLNGFLSIPKNSKEIIVFVHGSGSSRNSPRNLFVAKELQDAGFSTLLFDLLTEEEDTFYEKRFDIPLLAQRLESVTKWLLQEEVLHGFKIGYFGASTGAAAAIIAAVNLGKTISAIVSRGGRPDLAGQALLRLKVPTFLIVGGDDTDVILLNKQAADLIPGEKRVSIVPGATHLFEESGTLEEVAILAIEWFSKYLGKKIKS